ncbi:MAG: DUF1800 domain-containing protein [Rhodothermaceae bacterium]|nr:DUF1800 domain-containing protein [Rhodothermaceae bacterium]
MNAQSLSKDKERDDDRLKAYREKKLIRKNRQTATLDTKPVAAPKIQFSTLSLDPNTSPLTERQAYHLLRRTQFGAPLEHVRALVGQPADQVVQQLIDEAIQTEIPADPPWVNSYPRDYEDEQYFEDNIDWFFEYMGDTFRNLNRNAFQEMMMLFWHNHFVIAFFDSHGMSPVLHQYVKTLRTNAFGNFKTFVEQIGLDMSMLSYLNGFDNQKAAPNENYARELMELFTMGILGPDGTPNYTEIDISEMARAFTGYFLDNSVKPWEVGYDPGRHDTGQKTFFGHTGNFGYQDVVDIIFQERPYQIAYFICEKLYKQFVYEAPDPTIIEGLAQQFQSANFELRPILETLLKSQHFFSDEVIGAHIKSPAELFAGLIQELQLSPEDDDFFVEVGFASLDSGQFIFEPPNVAGWPGYRAWITTASIQSRWGSLGFYAYYDQYLTNERLDQFVQAVHDASDSLAVFRLPAAIVRHMVSAPIATLPIETISAPWAGGQPIPAEIEQEPAYVHNLTKRMLGGIPWYEWDLSTDEARYALREFLVYVLQLPEYQLA